MGSWRDKRVERYLDQRMAASPLAAPSATPEGRASGAAGPASSRAAIPSEVGSQRAKRRQGLSDGGQLLEGIAIAYAILGVLTGIALAVHTTSRTVSDGGILDQTHTETSHPWVAYGISVAVSASVLALVLWLIGRTARVIADHVAEHSSEASTTLR